MKNYQIKYQHNKNMNSLSSILEYLAELGFESQFKATEQGLLSMKTQKIFKPEQINILHFYRFEGESDPSDSSIVYGIETNAGEKGTLIDGYGISSDSLVNEFTQKVIEIHN